MSYHVSLASPAFPQPISRPSASPHTIVRRSIESLAQASAYVAETAFAVPPHPVFLGSEEKIEQLGCEGTYEEVKVDVLEIDLDEDGPLREEYLPRRRISAASSTRHSQTACDVDKHLPPPARWSPESDEPITRGQLRAQSHFPAPHPIPQMSIGPPPPAPAPFHQSSEGNRIWSMDRYATKQEPVGRPAYLPPMFNVHPQPTYVGYEYGYPPAPHLRSQSLSFQQSLAPQPQGHYRAFSQSRYDGGYSDYALTESRFLPVPTPATNLSNFDRPGYSHLYGSSFDFFRSSLKV